MMLATASPCRWAAARLLSGVILATLFLLAGFRLPAADAADMPVATAARVAGDEARTRFVADLSVPVGYTVYVMANPYRVMIDLPQVSFSLPEGAGENARGLVTRYRFGPVDDAHSRIVLDTDGPVLIDKAFLQKPKDGQPARIVVDIVRTTLALADNFGLRTVAEGIEDAATLAALHDMGCELGQGFGIARPADLETVVRWMQEHAPSQQPAATQRASR